MRWKNERDEYSIVESEETIKRQDYKSYKEERELSFFKSRKMIGVFALIATLLAAIVQYKHHKLTIQYCEDKSDQTTCEIIHDDVFSFLEGK